MNELVKCATCEEKHIVWSLNCSIRKVERQKVLKKQTQRTQYYEIKRSQREFDDEKEKKSIVVTQILDRKRVNSVEKIVSSVSQQNSDENLLIRLMNAENREKAFAKSIRNRFVIKKHIISESKMTHSKIVSEMNSTDDAKMIWVTKTLFLYCSITSEMTE